MGAGFAVPRATLQSRDAPLPICKEKCTGPWVLGWAKYLSLKLLHHDLEVRCASVLLLVLAASHGVIASHTAGSHGHTRHFLMEKNMGNTGASSRQGRICAHTSRPPPWPLQLHPETLLPPFAARTPPPRARGSAPPAPRTVPCTRSDPTHGLENACATAPLDSTPHDMTAGEQGRGFAHGQQTSAEQALELSMVL